MSTVNTGLTKTPNRKMVYTKRQLTEIRNCMHPEDGPMYFMKNFMQIQHPTKGSMAFDPFEYQYGLVDTYHNYRNSIAMIGRQLGKALDLETPILTPNGFVRMGDLNVGDTIYGRDGKPTQITFITETMHDHDVYEVEFDNGEIINADAEHLWTVGCSKWRGKNKERDLTTEDLIPLFEQLQDRSKPARPYINGLNVIEFQEQEVEIDPYLLGLWIGDGNSSQARITCHRDDYLHYEEVLRESSVSISEFRQDKRTENTGYFSIYGLESLLKSSGLFGNKEIPDHYVFNSLDVRIKLLQGLMDSAGYAMKGGTSQFYQSNRDISDKVRLLLSTVGIKSTQTVKKTNFKDCYVLTFCSSEHELFSLPRKLDSQQNTHGYVKNKRFYITRIEKRVSVPVRCLQVDNPEHLFLCGESLIPTHNTTVASGYLLWYAMFVPNSTILVAAHKFLGAQEIMQRIRYAYECAPDHIRAGATEYNKQSITFDNGSRIVAQTTTENTGRGMSLSLVYLDEFAFVEPRIAREFWTSLSPTLSTGGKCLITSTPNTDEDQFAEIWFGATKELDEYGNKTKVGVNGFKSFFATYEAHPDRDKEWASVERAKIGEDRFRREHECQFVSFEELLINPVKLLQLEGMTPLRKTGQVRWYGNIDKNNTYVVTLDPSMGTGGDHAAIQVWELPTLRQVGEWQHNKTPVEGQMRVLRQILQEIEAQGNPEIYWSVESNTLGEACLYIIRDTGEEFFPGTFMSEPSRNVAMKERRKGFLTTNKSKIEACAKLKHMIESDRMELRSRNLISELKTYIAKGNTFEAREGDTDDLIASTLLFVRAAQHIASFDDRAHSAMNDDISPDGSKRDDGYESPMPVAFC